MIIPLGVVLIQALSYVTGVYTYGDRGGTKGSQQYDKSILHVVNLSGAVFL